MASWSEIEAQARELVEVARGFFDAGVHKTLATLRRDGSPRISGTEVIFAQGELWIGSMWGSLKALDLKRDPRFSLHSGSIDPPAWRGDAKLGGLAIEITDPACISAIYGETQTEPSHLFRADITELSVVRLSDSADYLIIESWHPDRGVTRRERR